MALLNPRRLGQSRLGRHSESFGRSDSGHRRTGDGLLATQFCLASNDLACPPDAAIFVDPCRGYRTRMPVMLEGEAWP
jgi:hypothetical protein